VRTRELKPAPALEIVLHRAAMNFTSQKTGSGVGTLKREGIQPQASRLIPGTKYSSTNGASGNRARDQLNSAQLPFANRNYSTASKAIGKNATNSSTSKQRTQHRSLEDLPSFMAQSHYLLHSRRDWLPLGDGWHQVSVSDSGETSKCGLHSVIDNNHGSTAPFVCLYEPRLPECYNACRSAEPFYDLSLQAKIIHSNDPLFLGANSAVANREASGQAAAEKAFGNSMTKQSPVTATVASSSAYAQVPNFQVLFCFTSFANYFSLTCDLHTRSWTLCYCTPVRGDQVVAQALDQNIRANQFYHVLIQLRGTYVSIDINSSPVFTSVRCPDGMEDLSGLPGLAARGGAKFALKGWKLASVNTGILKNSASGSGGGILAVESAALEATASPIRVTAQVELENERELDHEMEYPGSSYEKSYGYNSNRDYSIFDVAADIGVNSPGVHVSNSPKKSKQPVSLADMMKSGSLASDTASGSSKPMSLADLLLAKKGSRETTQVKSAVEIMPPSSVFMPRGGGGPGRMQMPPPAARGSFSANTSSAAAPLFSGRTGGATVRLDSVSGGGGSMGMSYSVGAVQSQTRRTQAEERPLPLPTNILLRDRRLLDTAHALCQMHDKSVVDTVLRDVVQRDLGVAFTDIAALDTAKRLLTEAVVLPLMVPEFFTGIREPWKGVLLFGPPGTGKTLLAKAVCGLNQSSFFSCPSSSLVSKYRGESEKIVRCLFEAARLMAPSVVFLDEVDAIVGSRGGEGEHEASRRLKTEIFSQMDGIASTNSTDASKSGHAVGVGVLVLATTNCPWDLDEAMRRRLEKRIFIPMPDFEARHALLTICLRGISVADDVDVDQLCAITEGYSGADVHVVCREAAMQPMRKLLLQVQPQEIAIMRANGQFQVPMMEMQDFVHALQNTKPSVGADTIGRYATWMATYGSS